MKNNTGKPKKIKVKNTVPHLLSAVCNHEDCPEWLKGKIWNTLTDNAHIPSDTAAFFKECLKYSRVPNDVESNSYEVIQ